MPLLLKAKLPQVVPMLRTIDKLMPKVRDTILRFLGKFDAAISLTQVAAALADTPEKILQAMNLEDVLVKINANKEVKAVMAETMAAGGATASTSLLSSVGVSIKFDMLNIRSVDFIQQSSFSLIKDITNTTREAIREVTLKAFLEGGNPLEQAKAIKNSIGLLPKQAGYVANFRKQLIQQTNDPKTLGIAQSMMPANQRLLSGPEKRLVTRQLATGSLTNKQVDNLVAAYRKRLLVSRAETIARTETARAAAAGQHELWRQGFEEGLLDPTAMKRFWVFTPDSRVRIDHMDISAINPLGVGMDELFSTPFGPIYSNPAEPNCRCHVELRRV